MPSRRAFLRLGSGAVTSLALRSFGVLPALAQAAMDYRALVCIFLQGGNDANNSVIPMDDQSYGQYRSIRGDLALAGSRLTATTQGVDGAPIAFHANLAKLGSLYERRRLAVVANVGPLVQPLTRAQFEQRQAPIPINLFSHLDQQMQWQSAQTQGQTNSTGWGGRAADYSLHQNQNPPLLSTCVSLSGNSLFGFGESSQPLVLVPGQPLELGGIGVNNNSRVFSGRVSSLTSLLSMDTGMSLAQVAAGRLAKGISEAEVLNTALSQAPALRTNFPSSPLGKQMQQVAQIIQIRQLVGARRQIFFCLLEDFDTHGSQVNALEALYTELSEALNLFSEAMEELGVSQNVTAFTESEFNRTFRPNTRGGTDHGWGGHHFVMGGAVQGGRIFGRFPRFELGGPDDCSSGGQWIPSTSIDQYGATLCSWFGIPDSVLGSVFPNLVNFSVRNLGFLA